MSNLRNVRLVRLARQIFLCLVFSGGAIASCLAQKPTLSPKAEVIRHQVEQLSPGAKISVIPYQGRKEFGTYLSSDPESFTFHDVDTKADMTLRYEDVKHIRNGYGGYNSIARRHTDRTRSLIIGVVVIGALIGLVFAAAAS